MHRRSSGGNLPKAPKGVVLSMTWKRRYGGSMLNEKRKNENAVGCDEAVITDSPDGIRQDHQHPVWPELGLFCPRGLPHTCPKPANMFVLSLRDQAETAMVQDVPSLGRSSGSVGLDCLLRPFLDDFPPLLLSSPLFVGFHLAYCRTFDFFFCIVSTPLPSRDTAAWRRTQSK